MLKRARRVPVHLYPLLVVIVFSVVAFVLYFISDPYVSLVKPNFSGFTPVSAQQPKTHTAEETLAVWVDMSPSMYGYLGRLRPECVPSSYRMVFQQLPIIAKSISKLATPAYYRFTSTYQFLQNSDDTARSSAREKLILNPLQFENIALYQADVVKGGQSVSIPSVLNTLDLSHPSLILTDWEEDGLVQPNAEYAQPMSRIFDAGYCVSVVAMKSAFGGVLYNYTNEGINYGYANGHEKSASVELGKRNPYHHQPRPFYAIIIGTAAQCKTLADSITSVYQDQCDKNITAKIDQINKAHGCNASAEDFVQFQTTSYLLNDKFATLYAVDGQNVKADKPIGMTLSASSVWATQGTPEYTITRQADNSAQTASVTLHILPSMACYAQTYDSDSFTIPELTVTSISTSKTNDASLAETEAVLLARGPRRLTLSMNDFSDTNHWFACSTVTPHASDVSFQVTVQAGACEPGLYRISIPVVCSHSTETPDLSDSGWVSSWSIPSTTLKTIMTKEIAPLKTVNLEEQTGAIRKAEIKAGSGKNYPLAQLTLDFVIR